MKKIVINWLNNYRYHILVWTLYCFNETVMIGLVFNIFGHPLTYILHYSFNILIFYINAYVFLPRAIRDGSRAIWKVPLLYVLLAIVFMVVNYGIDALLIDMGVITHISEISVDKAFILRSLYRFILFMIFSTGYYFLLTYMKERRKIVELEFKALLEKQKSEKALMEAQNAYLKAQINPHFLFNTLNYIFLEIEHLSKNASEAVMTLSEMMRYAISADKSANTIELGQEIEQVNNLIYLYELRNNETGAVNFEFTMKAARSKVIPLLLLTLVENVFKHGKLSSSSPALIKIYHEEDLLVIETKNTINEKKSSTSNKTGLLNIRKRLEYAYNEKISMNYGTNGNIFEMRIKMPCDIITEALIKKQGHLDSY